MRTDQKEERHGRFEDAKMSPKTENLPSINCRGRQVYIDSTAVNKNYEVVVLKLPRISIRIDTKMLR
jgi:hypothetical protein